MKHNIWPPLAREDVDINSVLAGRKRWLRSQLADQLEEDWRTRQWKAELAYIEAIEQERREEAHGRARER